MEYFYDKPAREQFKADWEREIFTKAKGQRGLISMSLYQEDTTALALGVWESKEDAQDFMQTGIFKNFLDVAKEYLTAEPKSRNLKRVLYFNS